MKNLFLMFVLIHTSNVLADGSVHSLKKNYDDSLTASLRNGETTKIASCGSSDCSGFYTPTVETADSNGDCTFANFQPGYWIRVGHVVTFSGLVDMTTVNINQFCQIVFTLPIITGATNSIAGVAMSDDGGSFPIGALINWASNTTGWKLTTRANPTVGTEKFSYHFTYGL